jgi:translocation and assembly module TamB
MKELLLYKPFVWIYRILIGLFLLLIVLGAAVHLVLNSPFVVKKAMDIFSPDYNITYSEIKGNVLTGVEIKNAKFKKELLAKGIEFRWSPSRLLKEEISVGKLKIDEANVDVIKKLVASFSTQKSDDNESVKQDAYMPKVLSVNHLEISISPMSHDKIDIEDFSLVVQDIHFDMKKSILENAFVDLNVNTNISNIVCKATAEDNKLFGNIYINPKNELYQLYEIALRNDAIKEIVVDFNASEELVVAHVTTKAKQLLHGSKDDFNVNIDSFSSHLVYEVHSSKLVANSNAIITTPYTENINITNNFLMDNNISFDGTIESKEIKGFDKKFVYPLENLLLSYTGNDKSITALISSNQIKGHFISEDFKTALLDIETKNMIPIGDFAELPNALKEANANVKINVPMDFNNLASLVAKINVKSNLINVDANVNYDTNIKVQGSINIPKESLLKTYNTDVKWNALNALNAQISMKDNNVSLKLSNELIKANVNYVSSIQGVKGTLNLSGLVVNVSGVPKQKININAKVLSIDKMFKTINNFYPLENLPPIKGDVSINSTIDELKKAKLVFHASHIVYGDDKQENHVLKDLSMVTHIEEKRVIVESYSVKHNGAEFFSTKEATVGLGDNIVLSNFWLNDSLHIKGNYDTRYKKGNVDIKSKKFQIKDELTMINMEVDANIIIDGNDTKINGNILLLNGSIMPSDSSRSFSTDSDIVILQDVSKNKPSSFMNNLSMMLTIGTKESLRLQKSPINLRLIPDFTINKDKGTEIFYFGSIDLVGGGTYTFQEKKFVLKKSAVYFTGNINKPVLDIRARYKSLNHLITISVTGTPEEPNVNFSSTPSLTREEILSVILFDSELGGDTHSGAQMMKMMGGAMAKAALSDAGIEVDHLAFGEGNSVEVGKKLNRKTTVIYINALVPMIKLKYQHGKHTESVIGVSEESRSYDIIYKRDF